MVKKTCSDCERDIFHHWSGLESCTRMRMPVSDTERSPPPAAPLVSTLEDVEKLISWAELHRVQRLVVGGVDITMQPASMFGRIGDPLDVDTRTEPAKATPYDEAMVRTLERANQKPEKS